MENIDIEVVGPAEEPELKGEMSSDDAEQGNELLNKFQRYAKLNAERKALDKQVSAIKTEMKELESELLLIYEENPNLGKMGTANGTVYLSRTLWVGALTEGEELTEDLKQLACDTLKRNGLEHFVSEGFNSNVVSAYFRQLEKDWLEDNPDGDYVEFVESLGSDIAGHLKFTEKFNVKVTGR